MIYDVEHLFIQLLANCISSLARHLFRPFAHFSTGLFILIAAFYFIFIKYLYLSGWARSLLQSAGSLVAALNS